MVTAPAIFILFQSFDVTKSQVFQGLYLTVKCSQNSQIPPCVSRRETAQSDVDVQTFSAGATGHTCKQRRLNGFRWEPSVETPKGRAEGCLLVWLLASSAV